MSICTLTSPQPLTSSLKSSAVRSSRAFFGSTSRRPFLMACKTTLSLTPPHMNDLSQTRRHHTPNTYMQRLFSHHQHPVLGVSPHILVHIQRGHGHVDPAGQQLHLQIHNKTFSNTNTSARSSSSCCNKSKRHLSGSFFFAEIDSKCEIHGSKHGLGLFSL